MHLKDKFKITLHKIYHLIALQGPKSLEILEKIINGVSSLKFMNGNKFSYNVKIFISLDQAIQEKMDLKFLYQIN